MHGTSNGPHVQTLGLFPPLCRAIVTPSCTESWLFRTRSNLFNLTSLHKSPPGTCSNLFIIQRPCPPPLGWQAECSHSAEMPFLHKHFNKQEFSPVGCIPAAHWPYARVCFLLGGLLGGGLLLWGVPGPGGCLLLGGGCLVPGGSAPGGRVVSQQALRQTPPVNRMTDRCKNITMATTSLRPVKIYILSLAASTTDWSVCSIQVKDNSEITMFRPENNYSTIGPAVAMVLTLKANNWSLNYNDDRYNILNNMWPINICH